ncbi:MAG: hypothetical protein EBU33_10620, partial [Sphingobacteriia bacterium]|nr:hypothetical protein [Sphingobacteriia bacterium]
LQAYKSEGQTLTLVVCVQLEEALKNQQQDLHLLSRLLISRQCQNFLYSYFEEEMARKLPQIVTMRRKYPYLHHHHHYRQLVEQRNLQLVAHYFHNSCRIGTRPI